MHPAKKRAGGAISLRGHTAGVRNHYVRLPGAGGRSHALPAQFGAYDLAVSPAGTAAKILNVIFCHVASLEQVNTR
jgi:hypothetical protein